MRRLIKATTAAAALVAALATAGCGSTTDNQIPIGIGTGPNSLKASPCACLEIPNSANEPGYVRPQA